MNYRYRRPVWRLLFKWIDRVGYAVCARRPGLLNSPPRSVLLIHMGHLGDAMSLFPVISVLKSQSSAIQIDILVRPTAAALFEDDDRLSRVHSCSPFEKPRQYERVIRIGEWIRLVRQLRSHQYDVVFDLQGDPRVALTVSRLKSQYSIGYGDAGCGWCYDAAFDGHISESFLNRALRPLPKIGFTVPIDLSGVLSVPMMPRRRLVARRYLERVWADSVTYVLHPCAGRPEKWLNISELDQLVSKSIPEGAFVLLVGLPSDVVYLAEVQSYFSDRYDFQILTPRHVLQLASFVAGAAGVVTSDSFCLHLAGFFGRPTVAGFKGEDPKVWAPYSSVRVVEFS